MSVTETTAGSTSTGDRRIYDSQDTSRNGSVTVQETTGYATKHATGTLPVPSTSPYSGKTIIRDYV